MIDNCILVRQPRYDVLYDTGKGEILNIVPATDGCRPTTATWLHANLQLTRGCNLACKYCRTSSSPRVDTSGELSTDDWIRLFDQLKQKGVRSVFATGGEIFTRPDIWTLLDALEARFIVHTLINGNALAETLNERQKRIVARLRSVQVSLDSATPEVHDSFRGKGSWERAIRALEVVNELGVEAIISSVVLPGCEGQAQAMAEIAASLGARLLLRPLLPQGRGKRIDCQVINVRQVYAEIGLPAYTRGFLAYTEELYPFGIQLPDVSSCGVVALDPKGGYNETLDYSSI